MKLFKGSGSFSPHNQPHSYSQCNIPDASSVFARVPPFINVRAAVSTGANMSSFLLQEDDVDPGKVCVVCDCLFLGMSSMFLFLAPAYHERKNLCGYDAGPLILSSQFSAMGKQTKKKTSYITSHIRPVSQYQLIAAQHATACATRTTRARCNCCISD